MLSSLLFSFNIIHTWWSVQFFGKNKRTQTRGRLIFYRLASVGQLCWTEMLRRPAWTTVQCLLACLTPWKWKWKSLSCVCLFATPWTDYTVPWNSPGQNTGEGSLSLLQGIFPTQGSNPALLHGKQILNQLSPKGSPRILEWAAYPFSRGSSRHRDQTGVSCTAGRFFTNWAIREKPPRGLSVNPSLSCSKRGCFFFFFLLSSLKQALPDQGLRDGETLLSSG